ncbi:MAG: transcription termination/antitermination protein NusG [Eubacteriales bacterium]|nr:transcription termination/antitermination protein NusG [Eubacteriales bacterium]
MQQKNRYEDKPAWYVAHTYSGYEDKVKADIEKTIENRNLQDYIFEITVPKQTVTELKNGKEKKSDKKLFPGYILVRMIMTDETWYVIRNTRGVTGFVGPGSNPVPISPSEVELLSGQEKEIVINFEEGDSIVVTSGAWKDTIGKVTSINKAHKTVTIGVEMFGRETPVELSFADVKRL